MAFYMVHKVAGTTDGRRSALSARTSGGGTRALANAPDLVGVLCERHRDNDHHLPWTSVLPG